MAGKAGKGLLTSKTTRRTKIRTRRSPVCGVFSFRWGAFIVGERMSECDCGSVLSSDVLSGDTGF
ncbi:hypothetical protein DsansV1_C03g0036341 [Dioscorea sansibarensis]